MQIIRFVNQVVAFLLEIAMLISIGYWGFVEGKTILTKYSLSIFLPIVAIILWGFFAAPKSKYRLKFPLRIIFELCLFAFASILLYQTENSELAIWFGVIAFTNKIITYFFRQ